MTVQELYQKVISLCPSPRPEHTCDGILYGNPDTEIKKAAVCFVATAEIIQKAIDANCNLIICHEGLISGDESDYGEFYQTIIDKKYKLLDDSGMTVLRLHDHAHLADPDFIHEGFLRKLGLELEERDKPESFAVCRYVLKDPIQLSDLVKRIRENITHSPIGVIGNQDITVKSFMMCLGSVNNRRIERMYVRNTDLFIGGEANELGQMEFVREAAFFGEKRALLLLGHCGSEYSGMEYMSSYLSKWIPTEFLHVGAVYQFV